LDILLGISVCFDFAARRFIVERFEEDKPNKEIDYFRIQRFFGSVIAFPQHRR
jgi:hypothetical protein